VLLPASWKKALSQEAAGKKAASDWTSTVSFTYLIPKALMAQDDVTDFKSPRSFLAVAT